MKKSPDKMPGFTLIELMIAIAIAAILLTVAIPSFREMIMNNRISMRTNNVVDVIQFARSEAVRIGGAVGVTATSGGSDWGQGVTVWYDADGDDDIDDSEVLRVLESFQSGVTLNSDGFSSFQFQASGYTNDGFAGGDLDLCDGRAGETGRQLQLLSTGLIRVTTIPCS